MSNNAFRQIVKARSRLIIILLVFIAVTPFFALAVDIPPPSVKLIEENSELFAWFFGVALAAVCALIAYFVYLNDKKDKRSHDNNLKQWEELKKLWEEIKKHDIRLTIVETNCKHNHGQDS
jgi:Na+/melibiose symporter-like transporter